MNVLCKLGCDNGRLFFTFISDAKIESKFSEIFGVEGAIIQQIMTQTGLSSDDLKFKVFEMDVEIKNIRFVDAETMAQEAEAVKEAQQGMTLKKELSPLQEGIIKIFYRRTVEKDLKAFSSDDFRGLLGEGFIDMYLSHRNEIGALFGFMVRIGWIERQGDKHSAIPSSNSRRVGWYVWTERAEKELGEKQSDG